MRHGQDQTLRHYETRNVAVPSFGDKEPHRLTQRLYEEGQSWHYIAVWHVNGTTVRIKIVRNAYDHQSYGNASIFDFHRHKWNVVVNVPIMMLKCKSVSYTRQATPKDFTADDERLLEEALMLK